MDVYTHTLPTEKISAAIDKYERRNGPLHKTTHVHDDFDGFSQTPSPLPATNSFSSRAVTTIYRGRNNPAVYLIKP